ncbi:DNA internalization-related competence protein ComEC/Rec2 [Paenibacillus turpanensis]|uniref:DNA internalization-related competence protein ComEC/Rec2 n=1 Tax=Paenibacillus turpanensis TaxID=2689078 RepID=UPI0014089388|nr:DNA internalization-related competence protein ComEC/Rec2 [Paenibacillus turpanensis]
MRRPLIWTAAAIVLGYSVWAYTDGGLRWLALGLTAFSLFCIGKWMREPGKALLWMIVIFMASAIFYGVNDMRNKSAIEAGADRLQVTMLAELAQPPQIDGDRVSFRARAESMEDGQGGEQLPLNEMIQVTVKLAAEEELLKAKELQRGVRLQLQGELRLPLDAGNFGGFDYRRYLRLQRIHWQLQVKGFSAIELQESSGNPLTAALRYSDVTRQTIGAKIEAIFPDSIQSGYMKGLLLGERTDLDPEQYRDYSTIGMTHVLAISGLHVAVMLGGLMGLLRLFRMTREASYTVSMLFIPVYVLVTGASASVLRAGLMAFLGLYLLKKDRLKDGVHILCGAAILMLLWNPYYLWDVSFQLSYAVTLALMLWVPPIDSALPIRRRWLRGAIAVTTAAQAASFPLTIYYFNQLHLLSWLANFVLVPVISFIVLPGSTIAVIASFFYEPAGGLIGLVISSINTAIDIAVAFCSERRAFRLIWASPPIWWLVTYYASAFTLLANLPSVRAPAAALPRIHKQRYLTRAGTAALSAALLIPQLGYVYSPGWMNRNAQVSFIDIGQGDAALIQTPEGRNILVDGGGTISFLKQGEEWRKRKDPFEVGRKTLVPLLKKRGVHVLDAVIVSHADQDHIGGLQAVLEEIPVKALLFNGTVAPKDGAKQLFDTALALDVSLVPLAAGDRIDFENEASLEVLHPSPDSARITWLGEQNEQSVVFLLRLYESTFLFTGDIGVAEELAIIERLSAAEQQNLKANPGPAQDSEPTNFLYKEDMTRIDVLKAAHHGSKSSSSEEWLQYWRPEITVISAGASNVYGHPSKDALERMTAAGTRIYRTDLDGEVQFSIRSYGMEVKTKRKR